ncbi:MAG: ABC transporter substrate-binding protein [SAR324 cluster bacterium]|nr:ABC transporter substrate-binding protein [SAR324 cluster bacterium]
MTRLHRVNFILLALVFLLMDNPASANGWTEIKELGKGQTVYWNAWGGGAEINQYIRWVGQELNNKYDVELKHVKLSDTSEAVNRVLAEKIAGRDQDGSVDLIWINGENFAKMKENQLLFGPFTETLPNFSLVDFENKPTTLLDFTIPVDGLEAPWGMAQFNFPYNAERIQIPPKSMSELLAWSKKNTGRFSYPAPPDFLGSTFLQQVLIETIENPDSLQRPIEMDQFQKASQPLWDYLKQLHPHLWRRGETFPSSGPALRQLLDDGQVDIALSFNPADTSAAITSGLLPETTRTFVLNAGTIGNTHFVAIPYNASNREGALLVANFLLSPEAQAHKQNPEVWGDGTVLDLNKLSAAQKKLFEDLPRGIATLSPKELGKTQPNPHPDWRILLDAEWQRRYAN